MTEELKTAILCYLIMALSFFCLNQMESLEHVVINDDGVSIRP